MLIWLCYEIESASVSENDNESENAFKMSEIESFALVENCILLSKTFLLVFVCQRYDLFDANVQTGEAAIFCCDSGKQT